MEKFIARMIQSPARIIHSPPQNGRVRRHIPNQRQAEDSTERGDLADLSDSTDSPESPSTWLDSEGWVTFMRLPVISGTPPDMRTGRQRPEPRSS